MMRSKEQRQQVKRVEGKQEVATHRKRELRLRAYRNTLKTAQLLGAFSTIIFSATRRAQTPSDASMKTYISRRDLPHDAIFDCACLYLGFRGISSRTSVTLGVLSCHPCVAWYRIPVWVFLFVFVSLGFLPSRNVFE